MLRRLARSRQRRWNRLCRSWALWAAPRVSARPRRGELSGPARCIRSGFWLLWCGRVRVIADWEVDPGWCLRSAGSCGGSGSTAAAGRALPAPADPGEEVRAYSGAGRAHSAEPPRRRHALRTASHPESGLPASVWSAWQAPPDGPNCQGTPHLPPRRTGLKHHVRAYDPERSLWRKVEGPATTRGVGDDGGAAIEERRWRGGAGGVGELLSSGPRDAGPSAATAAP